MSKFEALKRALHEAEGRRYTMPEIFNHGLIAIGSVLRVDERDAPRRATLAAIRAIAEVIADDGALATEAERKGRLAAEARLAAVREAVTVHPAPQSAPLRARVTEMNTTRDHANGSVRQTVELDMFDGCEIAKAGTTTHRDELQRSVRALEEVIASRDKELREIGARYQNLLASRNAFERELTVARDTIRNASKVLDSAR